MFTHSTHVCMPSMYICMYVRVYVCMYVCMYAERVCMPGKNVHQRTGSESLQNTFSILCVIQIFEICEGGSCGWSQNLFPCDCFQTALPVRLFQNPTPRDAFSKPLPVRLLKKSLPVKLFQNPSPCEGLSKSFSPWSFFKTPLPVKLSKIPSPCEAFSKRLSMWGFFKTHVPVRGFKHTYMKRLMSVKHVYAFQACMHAKHVYSRGSRQSAYPSRRAGAARASLCVHVGSSSRTMQRSVVGCTGESFACEKDSSRYVSRLEVI